VIQSPPVQTTSLGLDIAIACVTFIASVGTSMFVAGTRWGELRTDFRVMADRLAKIEGMFELRLRDKDGN
jgi:hypothetical protein